jgi:hypothetical protein
LSTQAVPAAQPHALTSPVQGSVTLVPHALPAHSAASVDGVQHNLPTPHSCAGGPAGQLHPVVQSWFAAQVVSQTGPQLNVQPPAVTVPHFLVPQAAVAYSASVLHTQAPPPSHFLAGESHAPAFGPQVKSAPPQPSGIVPHTRAPHVLGAHSH